MKTKLNWKKKWLDDNSGYWYSAKVPVINWEYVIDGLPFCTFNHKKKVYQDYEKFVVGVFLSHNDNNIVNFSKKRFRKKETAMAACEKHLQDTAKKFNIWMNKK